MSVHSAGSQLAETPELAEMILLHLPLPSIIQAQRVNRAWCQIIRDSPKLQRALFLRPCRDSFLALPQGRRPVDICTSRESCDRLAEGNRGTPNEKDEWIDGSEQAHHPLINPVFTIECMTFLPGYGHIPHFTIDRKRLRKAFEDSGCARNGETSWKRMLFTQPPARELIVYDYGGTHHFHRINGTGGNGSVTLGDVFKHFESFGGNYFEIEGRNQMRDIAFRPRPRNFAELKTSATEVLTAFVENEKKRVTALKRARGGKPIWL